MRVKRETEKEERTRKEGVGRERGDRVQAYVSGVIGIQEVLRNTPLHHCTEHTIYS